MTSEDILSPVEGEVVDLKEVNDIAFAEELLGKGVSVRPSKGEIVAPIDGEIQAIFPTNHAIGILSNSGIEVLIHVGLNTVELNGTFFEAFVKQGDKVSKGQLLVSFDMDEIKRKGYDIITPVVITNTANYTQINRTEAASVRQLDTLIIVVY